MTDGIKIEVDASDVGKAKKELENLTGAVNNLESSSNKNKKTFLETQREIAAIGEQSKKTKSSLNGLNNSTNNAGKGLASLKGAALGVTAAFLSLRTAMMSINVADDYGQMASRLKMATTSAEEYALVQQRILETADRTYKPLAEQQELFIKSASSMREMGYSTAQTLDFLDSVSSSLTINSASAEKFARANDAISKSMVSGKISGDEWKAVMDTMPTAISDIADYLGTAEDAVKKMAANGKLSMQTFTDAMIAAQKKNADLADKMPTTVQDAVTKLRNHLSTYIGDINEATGATSSIAEAVGNLGNLFDTEFTADTIIFLNNLSEIMSDVRSNLSKITEQLNQTMDGFKLFGDQASDSLITLDTNISNVPINIKTFIQLAVTELANFIEQTKARVISLANAVAALPKGISAVKAAYAEGTKEIERLEDVRKQSIQAILDERDATIAASQAKAAEYKKTKDATQAQKQATEELAKFTEDSMKRAQAAAENYGVALDGSGQSLNDLMRSNKLNAGELTSKLNDLEKKLKDDVKTAGKTAAQTLDELGVAALKAAALSGASAEELEKIAAQLKNITGLQKQVDQAKADDKARSKSISTANSLAQANENYIKGLEKQYTTMNLGKVAALEYELSQRKLTGALLDRANAIKAVVEKEQELINAKANDTMYIEFLRFTGDDYTADLLELENKFKETTESLKKEGNDAGLVIAKNLFDAGKAKAELDKIKTEIEKAFSNQSVQEQSIQAQVTAGLITQYEAQKRITALHKQTASTVEQYLPALKEAAKQPGATGEQLALYATEVNNKLLELKATTSELENAFRNGLQDGIQSSIDGLVKGTMDLNEAVTNLLETIGSSILNHFAQMLAQNAAGEITGALGGLGKMFGFGGDPAATQDNTQALAITTASQEGAMAMQLGIEQGAMMAAQTLSTVMSSMGATNGLTGLGGEAGLFGDVTKNATEAVSAISGVTAAKTAADATIMASAATSTATTQATTTAAAASAQAAWAPAAATAATASFGTAAMIGLAALMAVMTAVKAFKDGGHVQGPGTGKSDSIPAWLSNDEFVIQSDVVRQPGMLSFLNSLNRNGLAAIPRVKHATGGLAGIPAPNVQVPSYAGIEPVENVNNNSSSYSPKFNVGIIQTDEQLDKFINSSRGKDSLLKIIKANPGEFNSVLEG